MICKTIEQMQRVANAGAMKMHRQGYTYKQNNMLSDETQTTFDVILPEAFIKPGNPTVHRVSVSPDAEHSVCICSCQFYRNHNFGFDTICKHIEYVLAEEADRIQTEAAELAETEREDAINLITGNERAHGSEWYAQNLPCHVWQSSEIYATA